MTKNVYFLLIFALLLLMIFLPTFSKKQRLLDKNRMYQKQIEDLKKENIRLAEEKRKLEEDPVYLESVAREKMGLVRDGEMIFRITPYSENAVKRADGEQ